MTSASQLPAYGDRLIVDVLDELALNKPDHVMYRYPVGNSLSNGYRSLTTKVVANAVNRVAAWLEASLGKSSTFETLAYIGPNDLRYYAIVMGASKAGYKVLLCSPRNSLEGQENLIEATKCKIWLLSSQVSVEYILQAHPMRTLMIPEMEEVYSEIPAPHYPYHKSMETARAEPFFVLHTSGSTGLPKPITITQGSAAAFDALEIYPPENGTHLQHKLLKGGRTVYSQMPMFHAAGIFVGLYGAIYLEATILYGPPPNLNVLDHLLDNNPGFDALFVAPSTLEDIAKTPSILNKLSSLKWVMYGGGPLSQQAGDVIITKAPLCNVIGSTESGWMQFLYNQMEDWNYFQPHSWSGFEFRSFADDLYQLVMVRKPEIIKAQATFQCFPDLVEYAPGDLFSKHPTKPNLFKSEGRADDVIVLSNGEKIQPLTMEEFISHHPLVSAGVVVGQARFQSAVIIEAAKPVPETEMEAFIEEIWPTIQKANAFSPTYSSVSRDHILIVQPGTLLRAAKGTVQRFQTVRSLGSEIDQLYKTAEDKALANAPRYDISDIKSFQNGVRQTVKDVTGLDNLEDNQDILIAGIDSLQVIAIQRLVKAGTGHPDLQIDARIIYTYPTISSLSNAVYSLVKTGSIASQTTEQRVADMQNMLAKYTSDLPIARADKVVVSGRKNVVLTGSTGSLGSYFLDTLIKDSNVDHIWLLNRSSDAEARQQKWNAERGLSTDFAASNVQFIKADMSDSNLGLSAGDYEDLLEHATHIIHNQWQVDFNLTLPSFEPHIAGIHNLVTLSAAAAHTVSLLFTSSVGTMINWSENNAVPEKIIADFSVAGMGYGESKLVSEVILAKAAEHGCLNVDVVRVGQIAGPVTHGAQGIWNRKEWLPTIVEASAYLGLVPNDLGTVSDLDWIPVDALSEIIIELALSSPPTITGEARVFHAVNPSRSSWTSLVPTMTARLSKKTRREMKTTGFYEWLQVLKAAVEKRENADVVPGAKLLGFYEGMAGAAGTEGDEKSVVMDTTVTKTVSESMRNLDSVNEGWMGLWLDQWGF